MKRALKIIAVASLGVGAFLLFTRGEDTYDVKFQLADASGLKSGTTVVNGGVPIGKVDVDANRDNVDVTLKIKQKYGPVGKDATVTVIAQNALGQKQVELNAGNTSDPAPDGYTLPADRISVNTDLDQLLGALDPDTRTRLAILINEVGTGFVGRKMDFQTFLRDFAPAAGRATQLIAELGQDNTALARTLDTSDRYIAQLATYRQQVGNFFDELGQASETAAAKQAELKQTLANAPGALQSTRSFLAELQSAAGPLDQTAKLLTQTAPPLTQTLNNIEPFRVAAQPALKTAVDVAPDLTKLADEGSPILHRAVPMLDSLSALSQNEIPPMGYVLNHSADNLFAVLENWSRAIQYRDKLGHIFRGEASFSPDFWNSVIRTYLGGAVPDLPPPSAANNQHPQQQNGAEPTNKNAPGDAGKNVVPKVPLPDTPKLPKLPSIPGLPDLLPGQGGGSNSGGSSGAVKQILNFLLGG